MNCWPIEAPRRAATKRAMKSLPPPGGKATTIFTGLTGYACACAELQPIIKAAAMNTCDNELCKERIGMSLWGNQRRAHKSLAAETMVGQYCTAVFATRVAIL